jgi:hypothetical protein
VVAAPFAWRSIVAAEYPRASAMIAIGASLVSSLKVPRRAARGLKSQVYRLVTGTPSKERR